jgi:hypothetical protein
MGERSQGRSAAAQLSPSPLTTDSIRIILDSFQPLLNIHTRIKAVRQGGFRKVGMPLLSTTEYRNGLLGFSFCFWILRRDLAKELFLVLVSGRRHSTFYLIRKCLGHESHFLIVPAGLVNQGFIYNLNSVPKKLCAAQVTVQ